MDGGNYALNNLLLYPMPKTRDISKPNKKQKQACPFLRSSEDQNDAQSMENIGVGVVGENALNWRNKGVKKQKNKAKYHNKILELGKDDFRRFGLRVNWTEDEDAKLLKLRQQDGLGWVQMEKYFPGRTDQACKKRYKKLEHKTDRRWTNNERDLLIQLVKEYGEDWQALSEKISTKTPTQIKTYYFKTLPKRGWTAEENCKLIEVMKKYEKIEIDKVWDIVASQFPGRNPELIREHYEITLGRIAKKKIRKQKQEDYDVLSEEEDE